MITRRLQKIVPALALSLAFPATLSAQIAPSEYAARRQALLATIDSGVVLAFGGATPTTHWPAFAQLPGFAYLTGFGEPDAALVMVKRGGASAAQLFVPPHNARVEMLMGPRVGPAEAQTAAGIAGRPLGQLGATVDSLVSSGLPLYVIRDVHTTDFADQDSLSRGSRFVELLARAHPGVRATPLDSVLLVMRAKKTPAELQLIRRAASISAAGHLAAMRALEPGCNEGEIQAALEGVFRAAGGERPGYGSIVGSGPNALRLHYDENSRVANAGEVVVIDAATAFNHYSADVTRTLPVSGRFSADQRAIYQIVLDAQAAFVRQIRPGVNISVANDSGRAVIAEGLTRLGLIESPTATYDGDGPCPRGDGCIQVRLFAWHAYGGHGIGLEVHDPAQYYYGGGSFLSGNFAVGDAFTVEPGIYVSLDRLARLPDTPRNRAMLARIRPAAQRYANIGVRIEDDYVITERGTEWISSGVPRDVAGVEAMMRQPPAAGQGRCSVHRGG